MTKLDLSQTDLYFTEDVDIWVDAADGTPLFEIEVENIDGIDLTDAWATLKQDRARRIALADRIAAAFAAEPWREKMGVGYVELRFTRDDERELRGGQ